MSLAAPSAFELAMNWGQYVEAVIQARTGGSYSAPTTFGIVGTPGIRFLFFPSTLLMIIACVLVLGHF